MMFRFPSFAEIVALFYRPTKVAHAIKDIEAAAKRADSVVDFNQHERDRAVTRREEVMSEANKLQIKAADHTDEATRAARVSSRLRDLVA